MSGTIFVPTLVDADNTNAQVANARAILGGWDRADWHVRAQCYGPADPQVAGNPHVHVKPLWRRHAWRVDYFLRYLRPCDLVFYPGIYPMDWAGVRIRRLLRMRGKIVMTFEGLAGDEHAQREFSVIAGRPIQCDPVTHDVWRRIDSLYASADHIVAISPFLARLARGRWGDKVSYLPLGVDVSLFADKPRRRLARPAVVCAGAVRTLKRPGVFVEAARRMPQADFVWFGEGPQRTEMMEHARRESISNVRFPGPVSRPALAEALAGADIFALPSMSEGVPKVTQEAAAAGVAQVIFGHYESPSVVDGHNGHVVWDDESFFRAIRELVENPTMCGQLGMAGRAMTHDADWAVVGPLWRDKLIEIATSP